jgi:molybdopterin converting factor small subunit
MATVRIPPVLRPAVGGEKELTADGSSVGAILKSVAQCHPETESQLFAPDGGLNRYVNVYLNDEDVRVLDGLDTAVGAADTLVILPAMAGGARWHRATTSRSSRAIATLGKGSRRKASLWACHRSKGA